MKWKVELIAQLVIVSQLVLLFIIWWYKLLIPENPHIIVSLIWLTIGVLGGVAMARQKPIKKEQDKNIFITVRVIGALISTVGIFMLFIPLFELLFHSKLTAFLIITGFFSPILIYKTFNRRTTVNT